MRCLIDTGCTTNVLLKRSFDRLPARVKENLEVKQSHGAIADGTTLPFYRAIKQDLRVKGLCLEKIFIVGKVSEDIILGMPFLAKHQCAMTFDFPIFSVAGKQISCTDQHKWPWTSEVQTLRTTMIPLLNRTDGVGQDHFPKV